MNAGAIIPTPRMAPERWQRIEQLYHAALEQTPERRSAFLQEASGGDEELQREVESLLQQPDEGVLDEPAWRALDNPLKTGAQLGPYEILGPIGEGGMGMVYKARDTRLNRFVAIKLLRAGYPGDEDRIRRFTREARTASGLNHPNIVTIYEISTHDGAPVIVMEYVAGRTLDLLIQRNGMRLSEVFKIGGQIASALAAAAAAGVIHRDVKPGNVMVTDAGQVKVLDFGLAKIYERAPSAVEDTEQPHTGKGAVLGTPSYMSPEQAEGKTVDLRSDIFSFGAVLYEMATGQRAFRGETILSTLSSILRDEPKPVGQLASGIPRDLEKIIARCLRKDPERRFQNMADVRVALLELKEESESGSIPEAVTAPVRKRTWRWAAAAAMVVASVVGLWQFRQFAAPAAQEKVVPVTTYGGSQGHPCFSPDGNQVAFSWDGEKGDNVDIYVKLLGETNALRLTTDPAADTYPVWAPDGKRIAFRRAGSHSGIYTVSALGGAEQKLSDFASNYQVSWSPDGKWLAVSSNDQTSAIFLLPADGGEPLQVTNPKAPGFDRAPSFSPDGRQLAYAGCTGFLTCDVYVQDLNPSYVPRGSARRITIQHVYITGLTWSRDGKSVIYSGSRSAIILPYLWRAEIDRRRPPQRLEIAGALALYPAVSPVGNRLVFSRNLRDDDIWCYRVGGATEPLIVSSLTEANPQFSPDGGKIAFESDHSGETIEIWLAQADGSKPVQMTNNLGPHQGTPRWSPDGRWIAFDSAGEDGHWDIYVMDASGGRPRRITPEPSDEYVPSWSHDGKWIYFSSNRTGRNEIWRMPFAGGTAEQVTKEGGNVAYESADGTTLFYTKDVSSPLFARPLSGGAEHQLLDWVTLKAFVPVDDGIYYVGRRSDNGQYPLQFFQFASQTSRVLTNLGGLIGQGLSVSPDRTAILFTKAVRSGANLMMIENFQ